MFCNSLISYTLLSVTSDKEPLSGHLWNLNNAAVLIFHSASGHKCRERRESHAGSVLSAACEIINANSSAHSTGTHGRTTNFSSASAVRYTSFYLPAGVKYSRSFVGKSSADVVRFLPKRGRKNSKLRDYLRESPFVFSRKRNSRAFAEILLPIGIVAIAKKPFVNSEQIDRGTARLFVYSNRFIASKSYLEYVYIGVTIRKRHRVTRWKFRRFGDNGLMSGSRFWRQVVLLLCATKPFLEQNFRKSIRERERQKKKERERETL